MKKSFSVALVAPPAGQMILKPAAAAAAYRLQWQWPTHAEQNHCEQ